MGLVGDAVGWQLLVHHRQRTRLHPPGPTLNVQTYLITYGELATAIGAPELVRRLGRYLLEVAEWCHANGHPPLNALAVNAKFRQPGGNYDRAGGFRLKNWGRDVERCIRYKYPRKYP
jgi:hypothetical protein